MAACVLRATTEKGRQHLSRKKVHPGYLARGFSDLEMLLYCAATDHEVKKTHKGQGCMQKGDTPTFFKEDARKERKTNHFETVWLPEFCRTAVKQQPDPTSIKWFLCETLKEIDRSYRCQCLSLFMTGMQTEMTSGAQRRRL